MEAVITISIIFLIFFTCSEQLILSTVDSQKLPLRYGFHRTSECDNYEKAFLCIQKCVDNGYDVAYSDKYCFCTCYVKKQKAKYTLEHQLNKTRWRLGTPKTTKPAWVQNLAFSALKTTSESMQVIKTTEAEKKDTTVFHDINNETGTVYDHNSTISDSTEIINSQTSNRISKASNRPLASDATHGTDSPTSTDATKETDSVIASNATNSADNRLLSNATIIPDRLSSISVTNTTDIEDANSTINAKDSASSATNATVSVKESEDTNSTIQDVKNEKSTLNASNIVTL
ncbi:uncharacterized protein YBL113C-like [Maniola jurtina]|uniref:uncharacterized protein YBL113C-like n=1 Tax=Maniola jurtina TaxID=191418 RepID=UPI001E68D026|nr:uncharacterized protein YBL113C-like [Maniola jurtina]